MGLFEKINEDLKQAANECIQIIQNAGRKKIKSKMEEF